MKHSQRRGDKSPLDPLLEGIRYSETGPLHRALSILKDTIDKESKKERVKLAALYLSDTLSRLGRYEEAKESLLDIKKRKIWDKDLESHFLRLKKIFEDLKKVEIGRFLGSPFLKEAILPDGKGGYIVDTLGFCGTWDIFLERPILDGAYLRFTKSLSHSISESLAKKIKNKVPQKGIINVRGNSPSLSISLTECESDKILEVSVGEEFLFKGIDEQRKEIRKKLSSLNIKRRRPKKYLDEEKEEDPPSVLLISLGLASLYAVEILHDNLKHKKIPTKISNIRSTKYFPSYLESYKSSFLGKPPDIFCISILDEVIELANYVIYLLRVNFPESFVIIGGPSTQTPEHIVCLVPDFDVMIRGDADEILCDVVRILGKEKRGLISTSKMEKFKELCGGLIVKNGNHILIHRLDHTNVPSSYHLIKPKGKKTLYFWQTSRGCPKDCKFCYKWTGKRYDTILPWEDRGKDSVSAMIDFLLERLSFEWGSGISKKRLAKLLKAAKEKEKTLNIPTLLEKIFIVIEDDDFLVDRKRAKQFCKEVVTFGLNNYFEFGCITSISSFFRKGKIDKELLDWLKRANFVSLEIGTDGLCQETIDQNQKGYTLDSHVIPLNDLLNRMGFFVMNNTVVTTPYTTLPQFIESLIFYALCPYPMNMAIEIGIMGHIGTKYTNEEIINQRYSWEDSKSDPALPYKTYKMIDNYRVPLIFYEYALNGSHFVSYADPAIRDLVLKFPKRDPLDFFIYDLPEDEVFKVIESLACLPKERAETRALGKSLIHHMSEAKDGENRVVHAIRSIKEEMGILNIVSFKTYYEMLKDGAVYRDPTYLWTKEKLKEADVKIKEEKLCEAESILFEVIQRVFWYPKPYEDLIMILLDQKKISLAVFLFVRYQTTKPSILFYYRFFEKFAKALNISSWLSSERALFHIPRYNTISPIFYFLALIKELSSAKEFEFILKNEESFEKLYELMDTLTVKTIKDLVSPHIKDIKEAFLKGKEVLFLGVPTRVIKEKIILDYDSIDLSKSYSVEIRG